MRVTLNTDALRILYMGNALIYVDFEGYNCFLDTDSVMFGLSNDLDKLVLNTQINTWMNMKKKWFCTHDKCKIPGLLKMSCI